MTLARGRIDTLWRYPVKGFTPERVASASFTAGGFFPCDRLYAVEDGPSGFDPAAPAWVSKQKFTVLAKIAKVAQARTHYDETTGVFHARAEGRAAFAASLGEAAGREAFAAWLADFLGEDASGPLKVVEAPGHRFTDHPKGHVSVLNLASVRDLEARLGRPVDPLRFRANLHVEGWPAWIENTAPTGSEVRLGQVRARLFAPIVRCVATHVDPATGERDIDLVPALHALYGHLHCGIYVQIAEGGTLAEGDGAELAGDNRADPLA